MTVTRTIAALRDDSSPAWIPAATTFSTAACAQIARFFAGCLVDNGLNDTDCGCLRNLQALYVNRVLEDGAALLHATNAPPGRSAPRQSLLHRLMDAPPSLSETSVRYTIEVASRLYDLESAIAGEHDFVDTADVSDLTQSALTNLAADARQALDPDTRDDLEERYRLVDAAESNVLRQIVRLLVDGSPDFAREGARLLSFMLADTPRPPRLERRSVGMLGLLGRLAGEIAVEADDVRYAFVAEALSAHFKSLSLDAAAHGDGEQIADTWLRLPPLDPPTLSFRFGAELLDPHLSLVARGSFMMRSLLISNMLSGHADDDGDEETRAALLCAARHAEQRSASQHWFPRQVSALA